MILKYILQQESGDILVFDYFAELDEYAEDGDIVFTVDDKNKVERLAFRVEAENLAGKELGKIRFAKNLSYSDGVLLHERVSSDIAFLAMKNDFEAVASYIESLINHHNEVSA